MPRPISPSRKARLTPRAPARWPRVIFPALDEAYHDCTRTKPGEAGVHREIERVLESEQDPVLAGPAGRSGDRPPRGLPAHRHGWKAADRRSLERRHLQSRPPPSGADRDL